MDIELEDFPSQIVTVYGQVLALIKSDGSAWVGRLDVEHIGYTKHRLKWGGRFHQDDYVEWIVRRLIVGKLQSDVNVRPLVELAMVLPTLIVRGCTAEAVEEDIYDWASTLASEGTVEVVTGLRLLYEWGWEEGLPGFSELRWEDLRASRPLKGKRSSLVTMRDVVAGPFTREELAAVEARLFQNDDVTTRQKAAFLLCRDWGLRPVQLALMRTQDLSEDEGGPFVIVCSVKGSKRSRLRRSKTNMVKRYIAPDTALALKGQIAAAEEQSVSVKKTVREVQTRLGIAVKSPPQPLFPARERAKDRVETFCRNPKITDYVLHSDSGAISSDIVRLTSQLAVPNIRGKTFSCSNILEISAYRLRRTKGTSLVLAGHSEEEVAEALDHLSISTVRHYFRYSIEFHAFINQVHRSSPELTAAEATWNGRVVGEIKSGPGYRHIAKLGNCMRDALCPLHPTVSCYGCGQFRPSENADHASSLDDLLKLRSQLNDQSTGLMASQLDIAVRGAKELVIYLASRKRVG